MIRQTPRCSLVLTILLIITGPAVAAGPEDLAAGKTALSAGELDKAAGLLQSAAEALPQSVDAQLTLGQCFLQMGRVDDALSQFRATLRLSPNHRLAKRLVTALSERQRTFEQSMEAARRLAKLQSHKVALDLISNLLRQPLEPADRTQARLLYVEYALWAGNPSAVQVEAVKLITENDDVAVTTPARVIAALSAAAGGYHDAAAALLAEAGEPQGQWQARAQLIGLLKAIDDGDDLAATTRQLTGPLGSIPDDRFRQKLVGDLVGKVTRAAMAELGQGRPDAALALVWPMLSNQAVPNADAALKPVAVAGGWLGNSASSAGHWATVGNVLRAIGELERQTQDYRATLLGHWLAAEVARQAPGDDSARVDRTLDLIELLGKVGRSAPDRKPGEALSQADVMQANLMLRVLPQTHNDKQRNRLVAAIGGYLDRHQKASELPLGLKTFAAQINDGFAALPVGSAQLNLLVSLGNRFAQQGKSRFDTQAKSLDAQANATVNDDDKQALVLYRRAAQQYPSAPAAAQGAAAITQRYIAAQHWAAAETALTLFHGEANGGSRAKWAQLRLRVTRALYEEQQRLDARRNLPQAINPNLVQAVNEAVAILKSNASQANRLAVIGLVQPLVDRYASLQRLDLSEALIAAVVAAQGNVGDVKRADLRDWAIWTRADLLERQAVAALQRLARRQKGQPVALHPHHAAELKLLSQLLKEHPDSIYVGLSVNRVSAIADAYQTLRSADVAHKVLSDFIAANPNSRVTEQLTYNLAQILLADARIKFAERLNSTETPTELSEEYGEAIDALAAFIKAYPAGRFTAAAEDDMLSVARTYGGVGAWPVVRQLLTRIVAAVPDLRSPNHFKMLEAASYLGELDRAFGLSLFKPPTSAPRKDSDRSDEAATRLALGNLDNKPDDIDELRLALDRSTAVPGGFADDPSSVTKSRAARVPNPPVDTSPARPRASDSALAMIRRNEQQQLARLAMARGGGNKKLEGQAAPAQAQGASQAVTLPGGSVLSEEEMKRQNDAADKAYAILLALIKLDDPENHAVADAARSHLFWMFGFFEGQSRHDHAIVLIRRYLKDQPSDPDRVALAYRAVNNQVVFAATRRGIERVNQAWVDERHQRFVQARADIAAFIKAYPDEADWVNRARLLGFDTYLREAELVASVSAVRAGGLLVRAADELLVLLDNTPAHPDSANFPQRMWSIADRLNSLGQRDQAIYLLNRITATFPTHSLARQALLRIAQTHAANLASPLRAVETYQEYLSLVGDDANIRKQIFSIGSQLASGRRYIEALHVYEVFVDSFPTDPNAASALIAIGGIHQTNEVWDDAIAAYERMMEEFPQSKLIPQVKFSVAECQINLSQWMKARKLYEDYLAAHPKDNRAGVARQRIAILKNLDRYEKLLADEAVERNKDDAQFQIGRIVLEQLNYPRKAIHEFRKVVQTFGKSHVADDAQLEIGKALLALNELDRARDELLKVASNHPGSPLADDALYLIAQSYERQAMRLATVTVQTARAEAFERGQRFAYRAAQSDFLRQNEDIQEQQKALKEAGRQRDFDLNAALSNTNSSGRRIGNVVNQSLAAVQQAETESAIEVANRQDKINEAFRKAVALYGRAARDYPLGDRTSESLLRMAEIFETRLKDQAAAKQTYERVVKFFPGTPVAENAAWKVAQFHLDAGDFDKAVNAYRDFIRNYPASGRVADAQFAMAEALEQLGRWVEAMDAYQTFRDKFAKHTKAPAAIEQINWIKAYRR